MCNKSQQLLATLVVPGVQTLDLFNPDSLALIQDY